MNDKGIDIHNIGDDLKAAYDDGYQQGKVDAQKWISVKERYPNAQGGEYICRIVFSDDGTMGFYVILDWFGTDEKPHFQNEGLRGMRVTHWMPLAKVPKEG